MRRLVKLFMIATIAMMAARMGYAQTVSVPNPLPNTAWPMDSVVRGMVKKFTVTGDQYFDKPSTFIWNVKGGRIFLDADTLVAAKPDNNIAALKGNSDNKSSIWVVWDKFEQPLDTGYVYVYERSANGCELADTDSLKFVGRRVKVSAPPKAWFIYENALVCNDEDSAFVLLKVTGMPPYDIVYSLNGVRDTLHLTQDDMKEKDFDDKAEEYVFGHKVFVGSTTDQVFNYELIEASSGGVIGTIDTSQGFATHNLLVHPIPATPEIWEDFVEVSQGSIHTYRIKDPDPNAERWFWELVDSTGVVVFDSSSTTGSSMDVHFTNVEPGRYTLNAWYYDQNDLGIEGCESGTAQLAIDVFAPPTIAFGEEDIVTCSAVSWVTNDSLEFKIVYRGARPYEFKLYLYDYNEEQVFLNDEGYWFFENQDQNTITFKIAHTLINDEIDEKDHTWTLKIKDAKNNESQEGVTVTIEEGVRKIIIHPKPFIDGLIDFYN